MGPFHCLLSTVLLASLIAGSRCSMEGDIFNRSWQSLMPPYNELRQDGKPIDRDNVKDFYTSNLDIPKVYKNVIRVATYNLYNPEKNSNLENFIEMTSPTIVFLQHVYKAKQGETPLQEELNPFGYQHYEYIIRDNMRLGIMIASKLPFEIIKRYDLDNLQGIILFGINVNGKRIAIAGIRQLFLLDNDQEEKAKRLLELIKADIPKDYYGNYIIMGSFNLPWGSPAMQVFCDPTNMEESFRALEWPPPKYTSLNNGSTTDYIFVSNAIKSHLVGSYFFYASMTGHLPIIIDIYIQSIDKSTQNTFIRHDSNPLQREKKESGLRTKWINEDQAMEEGSSCERGLAYQDGSECKRESACGEETDR